ncbi:class I SAM-dependent methyltransferase [Salinithrix halophila]|uniref:Class I SAM-dependent methyltransferase n=1 Tax=Salinithrix halophila TaxID=1485204 RepID=A0ABV8JP19_9BACL
MADTSMYRLPDYYDWTSEGMDGDLAYYADLAMESGGPVLELGTGTGRVSLAIARHGIRVTGVDVEPAMLARAQQKAEGMGLSNRCRWVESDMTRLNLEDRFPLVIIPYRSFLHLLTVRDQVAALTQVRQHLSEDGLFVFNIFIPDIGQMVEEEDRLISRGSFPLPGSGELVEVNDFTRFDHFHQRGDIIRYYERFDGEGRSRERLRTTFSLRYIYPAELSHLLKIAGFEVTARWGGFRREPFGPDSTELVVEARKSQSLVNHR